MARSPATAADRAEVACARLRAAAEVLGRRHVVRRDGHVGGVAYAAGGTFNTGLLLVRATEGGRRFVKEWHELVVSPPRGSRFAALTSDQQSLPLEEQTLNFDAFEKGLARLRVAEAALALGGTPRLCRRGLSGSPLASAFSARPLAASLPQVTIVTHCMLVLPLRRGSLSCAAS